MEIEVLFQGRDQPPTSPAIDPMERAAKGSWKRCKLPDVSASSQEIQTCKAMGPTCCPDTIMSESDSTTSVGQPLASEGIEKARQKRRSLVEFKLANVYQVIQGKRLCFTVHRDEEHTIQEIKRYPKIFFFSCDLQERYRPFYKDFGPVNLGILYRFCDLVDAKYNDPRLQQRLIVFYTNDVPAFRTNAAFLLGGYMILRHGLSPEEAWRPFSHMFPCPFLGFRDAVSEEATYTISILDCFEGIHKAVQLGWYKESQFNLEKYEYWEDVFNGDMHQICPKFIAFKGPSGKHLEPFLTHEPLHYVQEFRNRNVSLICRLNEADSYDRADFERCGFKFVDLYFDDCTVPSVDLVENFLNLCDAEPGVIAVHCAAGLGRTGTLIALWMMKNHGWKANAAIAWLRIVRPGCVIGPQQQFLKDCDKATWVGNRLTWPINFHAHKSNAEWSARESTRRAPPKGQTFPLRFETFPQDLMIEYAHGSMANGSGVFAALHRSEFFAS